MKLSKVLRFLDPKATIDIDGKRLTVAEMRTQYKDGAQSVPGGDPEMLLRAKSYTIELYDQDREPNRRLCGWVEVEAKDEA